MTERKPVKLSSPSHKYIRLLDSLNNRSGFILIHFIAITEFLVMKFIFRFHMHI